MAVTINQQPTVFYLLSGNPIIWVFSSDQTAQPNFSYYVEIYIDLVLNSSHQVFPESGIYGKFDASQIAESELTAPNYTDLITGADANNNKAIYIKVYERYGATPTLHSSATAASWNIFKGKLFMNTWINTDMTIYTPYDDNNNGKFLTNCPYYSLREGERLFLYAIDDGIGVGTMELNYKDINGNSLNTESISINSYIIDCFDLSFTNLESYYSLENVATVEAYLNFFDDPNYYNTEIITINILHCPTYDKQRLHFLNQLGGIDAFTFNAVSKKSMTTQTNSFLTTQGGFNGAAYTYSTTNSQTGNYQVTSNTKLMLESDWVTEEVMSWLNDNLFTSPYILLETANGLQRVANTSASVEYKKQRNDMVFRVKIDLDLEMHSSMII